MSSGVREDLSKKCTTKLTLQTENSYFSKNRAFFFLNAVIKKINPQHRPTEKNFLLCMYAIEKLEKILSITSNIP